MFSPVSMPHLASSIPVNPISISISSIGHQFWPKDKWMIAVHDAARPRSRKLLCPLSAPDSAVVVTDNERKKALEIVTEKLKWAEFDLHMTEEERVFESVLDPEMSTPCKALLKRIICHSHTETNLHVLLASWVKAMRPTRVDWNVILTEVKQLDNPLLVEVMDFALKEDSFEAGIRDYTKLIVEYAKQNRVVDAENAFLTMKKRGFPCDQVTLTVMIHMYSKAGDLKRVEELFYELRLLGVPLDRRSYGSMIMAYIRAQMPEQGEKLLMEMVTRGVYAAREVYKALLRAYSTVGNTDGAQRVFDAIQLAGIVPDAKICALLINAYCVAGQTDKARTALENMKRVYLKPNDKCIAVMLAAYEKENCLEKAMALLTELERDGYILGEESYEVMEQWLDRLGLKNVLQSIR